MTLVFETDIRVQIDPTTNDAVVWGTDGAGRFRLVIPRTVLSDRFGQPGRQIDDDVALSLVRQNWSQFVPLAQYARNNGQSELVVPISG